LIDNVRKISSKTVISVYELYSKNNDQEFNADNLANAMIRDARGLSWSGEPLLSYEDFVRCVASQKVVRVRRETPPSVRMMFPVRGVHDVIGLLVIDCDEHEPETLFMIEAMSQVWKSQLFLLERNERDVLTGLLNRQALEVKLPHIFGELLRRRKTDQGRTDAKCLAILDLDKFKEVNDRYGHLFGDEVLVHFSQIMIRTFRFHDHLFRYGGEEFVAILNDIELDAAIGVLERVRKAVEEHEFPQVGKKTVSIGVIQVTTNELPSTNIDKADKALYYAKQHGRNRICAYEHLVALGQLQDAEVASGDIELF